MRCLGKYVYDNHLTNKTDITVSTPTGIRFLKLFPGKFGMIEKVKVDMGSLISQLQGSCYFPEK